MTLINSTTKHAFKEWLREYKKMFGPDPTIPDYMGTVSKFLTSSQTGVTSDPAKPVNIVLWETFDETVDLTGNFVIGEYYYFPALTNDQVKIKNGGSTVTLDFDDDGKIRNKNLGDYIDIGDVRLTLRGFGGTLGQAGQGVTYAISPSATAVNEGQTVTFTVTTTNIANGTTLYWDTTGGVNAADFTDNAISGNFVVNNNTATFTRTLANDLTLNQTEGTETFQIRISDGTSIVATSATITVTDTSYAGYTIALSTTNPAEGTTLVVTLNTVNVPNGTQIVCRALKHPYDGNYISSTDVGDQYQAVTINNNVGTWNVPITQDFIVDTGETFFIQSQVSSSTVAESAVITIADTSFTCAVVPSTTTPSEGDTVTFTVTTTGVNDGTNLRWQVNTLSGHDVTPQYGDSIAINNNTGTFQLVMEQDFTTDPGESFTVNIRNPTNQYTIATSTTLTITDTPWTVSVSASATTLTESGNASSATTPDKSVTYTVTTTGVPNGTELRMYPVYVSGSKQMTYMGDIKDASNSTYGQSSYYPIIINNNTVSKTFYIIRDAVTEGSETMKFEIKDGNILVATTPNLTITDSSYIGSRDTGKTHGPIRVNRDGGVLANASDWYTICGLDKLPNGSKVAIFVDTSGSMTMSTIQASHDLLIQKLQARNMDVIVVQNGQEDWITPFQQILN